MCNRYTFRGKMSDVDLEPYDAMRQASLTAAHYMAEAYSILKNDYEDWTISDVIELSKIMAQDFNTAMMSIKMQEIRDAISERNEDS